MASWVGFDRVTITRSGAPDRNGYGAVRQMKGLPGKVQEEVLAWNPPHGYRYRVTQGSPFVCHQGEVRLQPVGQATELVWTIRFRPRLPGTGALLRWILGDAVRKALRERLKPLVEGERCERLAPRADRGLNAMTTISGKTIYITGGTRGIGLAVARHWLHAARCDREPCRRQ